MNAGSLRTSRMTEEKLYYVYMVADRSRVLYVGLQVTCISGYSNIAAEDLKDSHIVTVAILWFGSRGMEDHLTRLRGRSRSNDGAERRKSF